MTAAIAAGVVLLIIHIAAQGGTAVRERGLAWNAGPRDGAAPPTGRIAGRAARALDNYKETFPAFVALALALAVTGQTDGAAPIGAWLWIAARFVYLPLYLAGVPWVRTAVFAVAMAALVTMLVALSYPG